MAMAVRNEGAKVNSNINVTPMVDVMLVVLIIFMVITPMLQKGVTVDLAQTLNPKNMEDAEKEDALIVAVMKDGSIFFDTQKVQAEELTPKVRDRLDHLSNRAEKKVYVKADARAKYKSVVDVVDNVRSAGVDTLGLLTEQKKTTGPQQPPPQS